MWLKSGYMFEIYTRDIHEGELALYYAKPNGECTKLDNSSQRTHYSHWNLGRFWKKSCFEAFFFSFFN